MLFTSRLLCSLFSVLASLNLPAAIEDLSGQTIPKSVLDKSAAVNEKGGLNAIDKLMQDLPELLERNREILDEVNFVESVFSSPSPPPPPHPFLSIWALTDFAPKFIEKRTEKGITETNSRLQELEVSKASDVSVNSCIGRITCYFSMWSI